MREKYNIKYIVVFGLASALTGGFLGSQLALNRLQAHSPITSDSLVSSSEIVYVEESQVIEAVETVSSSVVSIVISKDLPLYRQGYSSFGDPFSGLRVPVQEPARDENGNIIQERVQIGGGSGFVISETGLIVTNRHVVDDETANYTVITNDGREFEAEVLGRDQLSDFAVIQLIETDEAPLENISHVQLGDSDLLKIGQKVVAIGNALSEYQNTVTTGVVSGINRNIVAGSAQSSESLVNLIQTDAAINPGNSGGPLVNLRGEVIGINTAIAADGEGIGFAIPINDVKGLIETVEESGALTRPFLGVRFMMLDEIRAEEFDLSLTDGALVVSGENEPAIVPGGPADGAGLLEGDVIVEVDGEAVTLDNPLHRLLARKQPDDKIELEIWRGGESLEIEAVLGESD